MANELEMNGEPDLGMLISTIMHTCTISICRLITTCILHIHVQTFKFAPCRNFNCFEDLLFVQVMALFRYLHGKDVFEAFHKKMLANLLLLGCFDFDFSSVETASSLKVDGIIFC